MQQILSNSSLNFFFCFDLPPSVSLFFFLSLSTCLSFCFTSMFSLNIDLSKFLWKIGVIRRGANISALEIGRKGQKGCGTTLQNEREKERRRRRERKRVWVCVCVCGGCTGFTRDRRELLRGRVPKIIHVAKKQW